MIRRFRAATVCCAVLVFVANARAEKPEVPTLGKIERIDPAFDKLVAKDAIIELVVKDKFMWAEGPVWVPGEKGVIFSDIPRNLIWKFSDGKLEEYIQKSGYSGTAKFEGREPGSNGLALNKDGQLVLCQHGDRRVAVREKDGTFKTLADKYMGKRLNSPNDLVIKSNGDIYFTDPPYGLPKQMDDPGKELDFQGVYRLTPKGELTLLTKEMSRPNGICLSPDEKKLYVANSDSAKAIWNVYPVKEDGTLGEAKVFFDSTKMIGKDRPGGPDGMKVDTNGNLWATGPGGVMVFSPEGKHLGTLFTGVPTANCGWGDDGSTLYITADKNLVRVKTLVKGHVYAK